MTSDGAATTGSPVKVSSAFGAKTVTLWGGIALLTNNLTGPGMVLFPSLFQQAGWIPVIFTLAVISILSYMCGLMLIDAIRMMPGNRCVSCLRLFVRDPIHFFCSRL